MRMTFAWLAAAIALTSASGATASAIVTPIRYDLYQSFDVASPYDLHHGIIYNTYNNPDGSEGAGMTNSFNLSAPGGHIEEGFRKSPDNPPVLTYIMATSNLFDLVASEEGTPDGHLVIAFNDAFATALLEGGKDFSETFSGYDESSLIAALTLLDTSDFDMLDPGYAAQKAAKEDASQLLFDFSDTVKTLGGLTVADGGTFTLLAFSTPGAAGGGTANLTRVAAVPEPGTWLMMVGGFGVLGFALRRRSQAAFVFG